MTPDPAPNHGEQNSDSHYRFKLSQNQKRRSKLQQVADEPAASPAQPEPPPPTPAAPPPVPLLRRTRLKRSGHMHEDLTKPLPEEKPRETEY